MAEVSSIIGDVARLTPGSASQRIAKRITNVRALLKPWERTKSVRELDERLATYPQVVGSGNGRTKRT